MEEKVAVFREVEGSYQSAGVLRADNSGLSFSYALDYLGDPSARALSASLPLRENPFGHDATSAFFDGLLPEGTLRRALAAAVHASPDDVLTLVSRLNDESAGALVFCEEGEDPSLGRGYESLDFGKLVEFALSPRAKALELDMAARLSLAGAQSKVGLFHEGSKMDEGWALPKGSAPSTHIVKAADGTFENQSVNEALCLKTMEGLGFDVAHAELVAVKGAEPLLVIERFDRMVREGTPFPTRRHQADFAQELGLSSEKKYEPTDGGYAVLGAGLIAQESANPFSDRMMFFSRLLADWALGNCDNHLKNHSLLWRSDWSACELSPVYDVMCTTAYPPLAREMGVALCESRRIEDVTFASMVATARNMGVPEKLAASELAGLLDAFLPTLDAARRDIVEQGFPEAISFARHIKADFEERAAPVRRSLEEGLHAA